MDERIREKLREFLLECYGEDIDEARFYFSTSNYAFIFPEKPFMIRVSITQRRTRQEILSELLWVDDLKAFKETICEPAVSLRGKLLEEMTVDGMTYRASMFRTARGKVSMPSDMTPMYFICVGELLGSIHEASRNQTLEGMKYQRPECSESVGNLFRRVEKMLPEHVTKKIYDIESRINAIPRTADNYGMCHGDFHRKNFFVEANNIWLFDFDACRYAYYLYDIACFLQDSLVNCYKPEKDAESCLYEDILPYFRIGYELHRKVDDHFYDDLELFIAYRAAIIVCNLQQIKTCGIVRDLEGIRELYILMISEDNAIRAMTRIREYIYQAQTGKTDAKDKIAEG